MAGSIFSLRVGDSGFVACEVGDSFLRLVGISHRFAVVCKLVAARPVSESGAGRIWRIKACGCSAGVRWAFFANGTERDKTWVF